MGNPIQATPDQKPQASPPKESFLGIPLNGWAVFAVSLIAVCATLIHYSIRIYGDWQDEKGKTAQVTTEKDKLASVNQITSTYTNLITQEMKKHENDKSGHQFKIHSDNGGETVATYFESDGCIAISRPGPKLPYLDHPGDRVEWSLGPSVEPKTDHSTQVPASTRSKPRDDFLPSGSSEHALSLARSDPRDSEVRSTPRIMRVQAGCLNPHPWPFQSWWGPANGCFAQMYRKWADGCTHYQMYNSCTGQWDPRIYWTYCNPNHHP